jgi:hypothetical protein
MTKTPNMFRDQDEFSVARRLKFEAELLAAVKERTKGRPEPKDKQHEEPPICTANETDCLESVIPAGKVFQFKDYQSKRARQDSMFRAFGRHKARNWRLMQERDEKRQEAVQENQAVE